MNEEVIFLRLRARGLPADLRRQFLGLMRRYYLGVRKSDFERDLAAKDWVFALFSAEGACVGFSTQVVFEERVQDRAARIVFSGDTVVERAWRRSWLLPVGWGLWMESLRRADPRPLYWLLISKGYRTYRFLPVFLRRFAPRDPLERWERELCEKVARRLGGERFDATCGVIRAAPGGQRLRPEEAPVTPGRLRDPEIEFFVRANPGHARGDDLVCLAPWRLANVRDHLRRRIREAAAAQAVAPEVRVAHARWAAACRPAVQQFARALVELRATQERRLAAILRANADTAFGREHDFARCRTVADYRAAAPPRRYEELLPWLDRAMAGEANVLTRVPIRRWLPTSGSDGAAKWIPWTDPLHREFLAGIRPWLAALYRQWPAIREGRMYWCLTPPVPRAPADGDAAAPAKGFDDDSAYLDTTGRAAFAQVAISVPYPAAANDEDSLDAFLDATAAALLAASDLTLISVWSPTWLLNLLDRMASGAERLLPLIRDTGRRREVERALGWPKSVRWARLWPRLAVVSCWADAASAPGAAALAEALPQAEIQPKGLLATEGIVSIPWRRGADPVPAIAGHFLEFVGEDGAARRAEELDVGATYAVLLTTSGGLYRYRLGDRVLVSGKCDGAPTLRFVGREGRVCDLAGEKLTEAWALACLRDLFGPAFSGCRFALLAPAPDLRGYRFYWQATSPVGDIAERLDRLLRRSFHYDLARRAGQLRSVESVRLADDFPAAARYAAALRRRGLRDGVIKPAVLDASPEWASVLGGAERERS